VKTILGAKKVGHLGTLDPFASGLLLVGVNEGTKIADIFLGGAKSYRGVMLLGVETDTQDGTGKVIETRAVPPIGAADLALLESKFTGELKQVPPMFSALKKDGVRLYQLARQGKEIPREARAIRIDSLRLRPLNDAEIEFDVSCSRGTYVRTLASDMGRELGCGAHLKILRRVACDHLSVEQALTPDELATRCAEGEVALISLRSALSHLPAVTWQSRLISRLRLGQQEVLAQLGRPRQDEKLLGILDPRGALAALAEWSVETPVGCWRLLRIFKE
ncbi:MAG TPA: tRNA pseudouridine(55) synthase TruB, partial [Candidatus Binatus sp.]|nr:tRNA pseudouridine(55) synthase TruB [Candidatus Binatus sp.]